MGVGSSCRYGMGCGRLKETPTEAITPEGSPISSSNSRGWITNSIERDILPVVPTDLGLITTESPQKPEAGAGQFNTIPGMASFSRSLFRHVTFFIR